MIDFQRKILGDGIRNAALHEALKKAIVPGKTTVADIGAGTGYLSLVALKLGAAQCFLYDHPEALALARKIARENGLEKKCRFIPFHSSEIKQPVKVDLVISETLGNFATEEHIIENMEDAKRFLKPGGTLIPQTLKQFVVPVISERLMRDIDVWNDILGGINFRPARELALRNLYVEKVLKADLLSGKDAQKEWDRIDFRKRTASIRRGEVSWKFSRNTTIYGFACFWECELVPGVRLSTSPFSKSTHWDQIFVPLLEPMVHRAGDRLTLRMTSDSRLDIGLRVRWETRQTP